MKIDLGEALLSILTAMMAIALFAMSPTVSPPLPLPPPSAFIWAGQ